MPDVTKGEIHASLRRCPLPMPDIDSAPWWEGLRSRELLLQRCKACHRYRWPARAICNDCSSFDVMWVRAGGRGTIASWTVTHQSRPEVEVPYVVVLARLDEQSDLLVPGGCSFDDAGRLEVGAAVQVGFEDVIDENGVQGTVLRWEPVPTVADDVSHRSHLGTGDG